MYLLKNRGLKEGFPEAKKRGKDVKEREYVPNRAGLKSYGMLGMLLLGSPGVGESRKWGWRGGLRIRKGLEY